jgi:hypothetical protein
MAVGTRIPRTIVASSSTAKASPTPSILTSMKDSVAKMENTATMMTAALVTTPALPAMPPITASWALAPAVHRSRIRLSMNTW